MTADERGGPMWDYVKLADYLARDRRNEAAEDDSVRNLAVAGAGALPLAGLIGRKPLIHAGQGRDYGEKFNKWRKTLRPGDVILSGYREMPDFDTKMVAFGTGLPEGYHVGVYAGNGKILESTPPGGTMVGHINELRPSAEIAHSAQVLRPKRTQAELRAFVRDLQRRHAQTGQLERAVRKRFGALAAEGRRGSADPLAAALGRMDKKDLSSLAEHYRQVVYDEKGAIASVFKDALLPKVRSADSIAAEAGRRAAVRRNPAPAVRSSADSLIEALRRQAASGKDLSKVDPVFLNHGTTPGLSAVCSSFGCESLGTAKPVVSGKHLHETLPQDFLRSDQMAPVSRLTPRMTRTQTLRNSVLRQGPNMLRGLAGLGLAGTTYGLFKLKDKLTGQDAASDSEVA